MRWLRLSVCDWPQSTLSASFYGRMEIQAWVSSNVAQHLYSVEYSETGKSEENILERTYIK